MKYERIGPHEVHPVASIFPLLEGDELRALADDIKANGQREPIMRIVVDDPVYAKGIRKPLILDGRNRARACEIAGVAPEFEKYEGPTDTAALLAFVQGKNLFRRHLDDSQRAMVGARAIALHEADAKARMSAGGKAKGKAKGGNGVPTLPERARDAAAESVGVSGRLVQHAKAVIEKAAPEVVHAVERGALAVTAAAELAELPKTVQKEILEKSKGKPGTVRAHIRQHERTMQGEKLNAEPLPPPEKGPFRVIVADPPWQYEMRDNDASHRGVTPYRTMATDDICMMGERVQDIAHNDAVLFLWTTNQHMRDAFDVVVAWGFVQKAIGTWVKPKIGLGHYLRNQTEHFLLCVRGNPTITLTYQSNVIMAPVREHSRKPDEFYALVESLCPGSKVELFAREPREGWARWGAETEKFTAGGGR